MCLFCDIIINFFEVDFMLCMKFVLILICDLFLKDMGSNSLIYKLSIIKVINNKFENYIV